MVGPDTARQFLPINRSRPLGVSDDIAKRLFDQFPVTLSRELPKPLLAPNERLPDVVPGGRRKNDA